MMDQHEFDHAELGLEMEPLNPSNPPSAASPTSGNSSTSADPPAHKSPPTRLASFGNAPRPPSNNAGSISKTGRRGRAFGPGGMLFGGRSNGNGNGSHGNGSHGNGSATSAAANGALGRKRNLAVLFLLLGLALLMVLRGEEEVEMEMEASEFDAYPAPAVGEPVYDDAQQQLQQPMPPPEQQQQPQQVAPPPATPSPTAAPPPPPTTPAPTGPRTAEQRQQALKDKYGEWHFWDGEPELRPKDDYPSKYPNRDVPEMEFPETSWQVDAVYVNHFLNDAANLVTRAMEAIYEEYGHGKPLETKELMERSKMTTVHKVDFASDDKDKTVPPTNYMEGGGWTTERSLQGLIRRILHAVMTNDSFTVVLLGDGPEASGKGNHFAQTYGMQFQYIMEPIFARLNTPFKVHNLIREGGGGPLVDGLGFADLVGTDIDLLVWDSSGLDVAKIKTFDAEVDLLLRQAALSGNRVPYILDGGGNVPLTLLKDLHEKGGFDVGGLGMGWSGIIETESDDQAAKLPYAMRYLKCQKGKEALCDKAENKYLNTCWFERKGVKPPTKQDEHLAGADGSHPGWRYHQLKGRMLAVTLLEAMNEAMNIWSEVTITGGHPLPDEYWHVTGYYDDLRSKASKLDAGSCGKLKGTVPERVCKVAMKGRTEFTPRTSPQTTSITAMVAPAEGGYVPKVQEKMLYDGPDELNPILALPEDGFDVHFIVSAGIRRRRRLDNDGDAIVPGLGWQIHGELPGECDGTATGICGRQESSSCLLDGHMDSRGGILGNEYSGWLVMNVKNVQEGVIVLALETSHKPDESERTKGWTEARISAKQAVKKEDEKATADGDDDDDDDGKNRGLRRRLLPDNFKFEFAIDGKATALDKKAFELSVKKPRDDLELLTVLDDASVKGKDVEVAVRLRECGRDCTIALSHVFWA